jgi:hypothetical protein
MRTERVILSVAGSIAISALLFGCAASERNGSRVSQDLSQSLSTPSQSQSTTAARSSTREDTPQEIDWQAFWQSCLKKHGVDDFGTEHLIGLLDSGGPAVRMCSAELLGERKEASAIPDL